MALRELLLPWDAQPQEAVEPGLLRAAVYGGYTGTVGSAFVRQGAPTVVASPAGLAMRFTQASSDAVLSTISGINSNNVTLFAVARKRTTALTNQTIINLSAASGNQRTVLYWAGDGSQMRLSLFVGNGASFRQAQAPTLTSWSDTDSYYVFVGVISNNQSGLECFYTKDGVETGSTITTPAFVTAGNPAFVSVGGFYNDGAYVPGFYSDHDVLAAGVIPWAVNAAERARLGSSLSAWAEYLSPRRIFVPVSVAGTAHDGTGALSSDASTLSGTANHFTLHASSGALSSDASTIAGSANHIVVHPSSGALSSQDATLAGTALRYRQFSATGALDSASATIAGDAAHTTTGTFSATGALSAQDGTIAGTATHLTLHAATGAIQASDSTITGTAAKIGTHDATGNLLAGDSAISGLAARNGTQDEIGGTVIRRRRTKFPKPLPEAPEPEEAPKPTATTLVPQDAMSLLVESAKQEAGRAIKKARVASVKRRLKIEQEDERAIERALMDWF